MVSPWAVVQKRCAISSASPLIKKMEQWKVTTTRASISAINWSSTPTSGWQLDLLLTEARQTLRIANAMLHLCTLCCLGIIRMMKKENLLETTLALGSIAIPQTISTNCSTTGRRATSIALMAISTSTFASQIGWHFQVLIAIVGSQKRINLTPIHAPLVQKI